MTRYESEVTKLSNKSMDYIRSTGCHLTGANYDRYLERLIGKIEKELEIEQNHRYHNQFGY